MNQIQLVFNNGKFSAPDSDLSALPADVSFCADEASQVKIKLGCNSHLTVIEKHRGDGTAINITLEKGAKLTYLKLLTGEQQPTNYATTSIHQQADSTVDLMHFIAGNYSARENINIQLAGSGANFTSTGLYCLHNKDQQSDIHISVKHAASHTHSDILYKGILDSNARAAFVGHVQVEQHAQKITAQQANHHLLLSKQAEASSKPELEIYADDVKCKHGSTTGQLDQEALFYLRARGIQHDDAMNMLLDGFAQAVIDRVPVELRGYIG